MSVRSRPRVLLVYAVPFSGHAQAAAALHEALSKYQHAEVEEYHFLQQFKYTGSAIVQFYKFLLKYLPSVWGHVHNNPEYEGLAKTVVSAFQEWDITGLLKRIDVWKPDVIVAIQAFPLRILAEAKQQGRLKVPLAVVTTDFWAHRYWAHPAVDQYFVASERAKQDLCRYKIPAQKIVCTGIPLRPTFAYTTARPLPSQANARAQLGWPARTKTVLCVGGSYGFIPFKDIIDGLERGSTEDVTRWVIVFGNNKGAQQQAQAYLRTSSVKTRVRLYGFFEDMHLLMRASDVCLTKAGGLSASEALVCRLPLVFYRPLPGQERQNVAYLTKQGAALRAGTAKQAFSHIRTLLTNSVERDTMKRAQAKLAHPQAALVIADAIVARFAS